MVRASWYCSGSEITGHSSASAVIWGRMEDSCVKQRTCDTNHERSVTSVGRRRARSRSSWWKATVRAMIDGEPASWHQRSVIHWK